MSRGKVTVDRGARRRGRPSTGVREAILDATLRLIEERGLSSLTTAQIARRAGAAQASIHYHFGSKAELLEAAILHGLEPLHRDEREASLDDGVHSTDAIVKVARSLEGFYERVLPVFAALAADPVLRAQVDQRLAAHDLGPHRALQLVERRLDAAGAGEDADRQALALLLVGACFLRAWRRRFVGDRARLPAIERGVAALLEPPPR